MSHSIQKEMEGHGRSAVCVFRGLQRDLDSIRAGAVLVLVLGKEKEGMPPEVGHSIHKRVDGH